MGYRIVYNLKYLHMTKRWLYLRKFSIHIDSCEFINYIIIIINYIKPYSELPRVGWVRYGYASETKLTVLGLLDLCSTVRATQNVVYKS